MKGNRFDVIVVGAGPAGLATALRTAGAGHAVCVLERRAVSGSGPRPVWLSARAEALLTELKVPTRSLLQRPLTRLTFHDREMSKAASPQLSFPLGFLLDRTHLTSQLAKEAAQRGVGLREGVEMTGVELGEQEVKVTVGDGSVLTGRFLVMAVGRSTPWLERLGFPRHSTGRGAWLGTLDGRLPRGAEAGVHLVLGLDHAGSFVMLVMSGENIAVTLNWYGDRIHARPAFVQMCAKLAEHGLVLPELAEAAASSPLSYCPTALALELETHVGKNVLVVGDAGGFLAAMSNEGLYPAMWSGVIAADVLDEAFKSKYPQDTLLSFETRWRSDMASYLAPTNTDTTYLLPMIFTNPAMAERMARAFFTGQGL